MIELYFGPEIRTQGALTKPRSFLSKPHLDFIRSRPCALSGKWEVDPHHLVSRKNTTNDYLTIPLSREMHQELHQIGRESFESKYNVDLNDYLIAKLIERIMRDENACKFL